MKISDARDTLFQPSRGCGNSSLNNRCMFAFQCSILEVSLGQNYEPARISQQRGECCKMLNSTLEFPHFQD